MFKSILLGSAVAVTLSAAPTMAADFQALAHLQGAAPTPLNDVALTATEGGGGMRVGSRLGGGRGCARRGLPSSGPTGPSSFRGYQ